MSMWKKSERFTVVTAVYNALLLPEALDASSTYKVDWEFIVENSIYQKDTIDEKRINSIFEIYKDNQAMYEDKAKAYLSSYKTTPHIVKALLISLFLELDEELAIYPGVEKLPYNFLGKYPRMTQELIAGEYTALVNAIVRRIAIDNKLQFVELAQTSEVEN